MHLRPQRHLRGFRGLCGLRSLCGLRNRGLRPCLLLLQLWRDLLRRVQGTGCRRGCSRRVQQAEEAEGSMRIASGLHALHELLHEVAHAPAQQHQGLLLGCAPCGRAPPVQMSHEAAVGDRLQPLAHDREHLLLGCGEELVDQAVEVAGLEQHGGTAAGQARGPERHARREEGALGHQRRDDDDGREHALEFRIYPPPTPAAIRVHHRRAHARNDYQNARR